MHKLVKPINYNGSLVTHYELRELTLGILNNVTKKQNMYSALRELVNDSVICFRGSNNEEFIGSHVGIISGKLVYKTLEAIIFEIVKEAQDDTGIDGIYFCPRCNEKHNEIDYLNDIEVVYTDMVNDEFEVELSKPIFLKSKEAEEEVVGFKIRYPNIVDIEKAKGEQTRIYANCLIEVNKEIPSKQWMDVFSQKLFDSIPVKEPGLKEFSAELLSFGIKTVKQIGCNNCDKEFEYDINMSNFFVSSLRQA